MAKLIVMHGYYGCDTGCCGHYIKGDGEYHFDFEHPGVFDRGLGRYVSESEEAFIRRLIDEEFGPDHGHDIDFENSFVVDD